MLRGLLMMSGQLILLIVYGKEGLERREFSGTTSLVLSLVFILWLFGLVALFSGKATTDIIFGLIIGIGIPAGIASWSVKARKKIRQEIENEKMAE